MCATEIHMCLTEIHMCLTEIHVCDRDSHVSDRDSLVSDITCVPSLNDCYSSWVVWVILTSCCWRRAYTQPYQLHVR